MSINHKNISVKIFMPRFFVSKSFHSQKTPLPYHFPKSSLFDSRKNPETRIPRHHNLKFRCIYDFEAIEAAVNRSTNRQLGGTNVSERTNILNAVFYPSISLPLFLLFSIHCRP